MNLLLSLESKFTYEVRRMFKTGDAIVQPVVRVHDNMTEEGLYTAEVAIVSVEELRENVTLSTDIIESELLGNTTKKHLKENDNVMSVYLDGTTEYSFYVYVKQIKDTTYEITLRDTDVDFAKFTSGEVSFSIADKVPKDLNNYPNIKNYANVAIQQFFKRITKNVDGQTFELEQYELFEPEEETNIKLEQIALDTKEVIIDAYEYIETRVSEAIRSGIISAKDEVGDGVVFERLTEELENESHHITRTLESAIQNLNPSNLKVRGNKRAFQHKVVSLRSLAETLKELHLGISGKIMSFEETYRYTKETEMLHVILRDVEPALDMAYELYSETGRFIFLNKSNV